MDADRQIAVIGIDDDYGIAVLNELAAESGWLVTPISTERPLDTGVWVIDGTLHDSEGHSCPIGHIDTLRGRHNWQNAAATWPFSSASG